MFTVGVIDLGDNNTKIIQTFIESTNKIQKSFHFYNADPITLASMGEPTLNFRLYEIKFLFNLLKNNPRYSKFDFLIGITSVEFSEEDYTHIELDKSELGYFSQSDFKRLSIISIHENVIKYNCPKRTTNQYLSFLFACEILMNITKKDLSHEREMGCLFDECTRRSNLINCIRISKIQPPCTEKLVGANVSNQIIEDINKILDYSRRHTFAADISALRQNPVTIFTFGLFLGWLLDILFNIENIAYLGTLTIIILLIIFYYERYIRK